MAIWNCDDFHYWIRIHVCSLTFQSMVTLFTVCWGRNCPNFAGNFWSSRFFSPPRRDVQSHLLSFFQTLRLTPQERTASMKSCKCWSFCWHLGLRKLSFCQKFNLMILHSFVWFCSIYRVSSESLIPIKSYKLSKNSSFSYFFRPSFIKYSINIWKIN